MKTLLLVDGSSYLYRAFHAMPDLRSPQGEPIGAIYGVLNMLRRLRVDYPADYSACVFDAKGKTFRNDLYAEYKAHRLSMPETLVAQIGPLHQLIAAFGWNILMVDGVEADDVIGTLAQQAKAGGAHCVISTGDKDFTQLVSSQVTLINTMSNEVLDEAGVLAKFGLPPERIVDYLTLIGDTADNVPGVPKVGPKTAVKWLTQYDTLDNLMAHAHQISGVVGNNLRNSLDWLKQGRALITIKCDVELHVRFDELVAPERDDTQLRSMLERYGLKSWLRELSVAPPSLAKGLEEEALVQQTNMFVMEAPASVDYEVILTEAQLDDWLEKILQAELVCMRIESAGFDMMSAKLVGIAFAIRPHHAAYLPLAHQHLEGSSQLNRECALLKLKPWLESATHKKLGQDLKRDQHILANHAIHLAGVTEDTLLQSYVLESHKSHSLDDLALRHLGMKTFSYAEVVGRGTRQACFDQASLVDATRYAAGGADATLQLFQALVPRIKKQGRLEAVYRDVELPVRQVLYVMERNGVLIDSVKLENQSRELGEKLASIEIEAYAAAGQSFNLNSPKQIQEILFGQLGLPIKKKTPSGTPSTDEEVLQELSLDYPLPKLLLEYRGMAKLKSTYTDRLPQMVNAETGRVHTNYSQAVTVTGRLASSDPNLQNIPVRTAEGRRIREAFVAPQNSHIVSVDYSQIELRIMAHLSEDSGLLRAFENGEDIHRATAAEVFMVGLAEVSGEQRRYAKAINFGLIYGMSAFGLASQLNIERNAAQQYIDLYFTRYPGVADYMQRTREQARRQGYVETIFGRRLWLPEINGGNGMRRQAAERAAINAPMQGTAADLIKLAMVAVQGWIEREQMQTKLVMQVHDELVLEVPKNELALARDRLPDLMCSVAELKVPLEVGFGEGENWEAAH